MPQVCWQAAQDGRYWLDMVIANRQVRIMIDLGLVDPLQLVGFDLDPVLFDSLKHLGQLRTTRLRNWRSATGRTTRLETGLGETQLYDPSTRSAMGPKVQLHAARGFSGVSNRVGVVFFHRLVGCSLTWDLGQRTWCITFP